MAEGFYVTVRERPDGGRHGFLLGPYGDHDAALAKVDLGRSLAVAADPRAHFYAYGTAKVTADALPAARFPDLTGVV